MARSWRSLASVLLGGTAVLVAGGALAQEAVEVVEVDEVVEVAEEAENAATREITPRRLLPDRRNRNRLKTR